MEISKNKIFKTFKDGNEAKVQIFAVVEVFRVLAWIWYLFLFVIGVILTISFTKEPYREILYKVFGNVNSCAYFDFYPSTYVLPSIYAFLPTLIFLYCIASIFRAWIAMNENKINYGSFVCYSITHAYFFISILVFAVIFAIQPNTKEPVTIQIHTLPFTNLIFAFMIVHTSIAWFNYKVAWIEMDYFKWMSVTNFISLFVMILASIIKIVHHLNAVLFIESTLQIENGEILNNGFIWYVQDHDTLNSFFVLVDIIWMLSVIALPILQGGYLLYRGHDTHGLIITIEDNRTSRQEFVPFESS